MITLYEYINDICNICEKSNVTSDAAIYYKIGKYRWNWGANKSRHEALMKKYNISKSDPRPGLIRYAKDTSAPILPDKDEVIHRKDWDLDSLNGETELQLLHPDYWTLAQFEYKDFKRKRDILTIFECSNVKPYSYKSSFRKVWQKYALWTDFACMSNPGVIPMEYSHFFPTRFDEWDHFAENDDIADKYVKVNMARFLHYVKKMGYKHVLVVMQHPHTQKLFDELLKLGTDGAKDWLHIVTDSHFHSENRRKNLHKFNGSEGLLISRTMNLPYTFKSFERELMKHLDAEGKDKLKEFQKLAWDGDEHIKGSAAKDKLDEWLKENGYEEIDYMRPAGSSFKRLGEDDVDSKLVTSYKKWIEEKFLPEYENDIDKKDFKKKESWYQSYAEDKTGLAFTTLDLLLKYNKDKMLNDPDTQYWSMKKAIKEIANSHHLDNWKGYCWWSEDVLKDAGVKKKDLLDCLNGNGLIQTELKQQDVEF